MLSLRTIPDKAMNETIPYFIIVIPAKAGIRTSIHPCIKAIDKIATLE
jgi:hypothetical protein